MHSPWVPQALQTWNTTVNLHQKPFEIVSCIHMRPFIYLWPCRLSFKSLNKTDHHFNASPRIAVQIPIPIPTHDLCTWPFMHHPSIVHLEVQCRSPFESLYTRSLDMVTHPSIVHREIWCRAPFQSLYKIFVHGHSSIHCSPRNLVQSPIPIPTQDLGTISP